MKKMNEEELKVFKESIKKSIQRDQEIFDKYGIGFSIKNHWKEMLLGIEKTRLNSKGNY